MKLKVLTAAVLLAGCAASGSIQHAGYTREYVLHVPDGLQPGSPLLIALHGGGGKAGRFARYTGFSDLAEDMGFAVVYPQGINNCWYDSYHLMMEPDMEGIDDQGFMLALAEEISDEYGTEEVFVMGMSNGGIFLQELLVSHSEHFQGGASVVAQIPANLEGRPSEPVPMLFMNGTGDPLVPYQGGYITLPGGTTRGEVLSTDESVRNWVEWNDLPSEYEELELEDLNTGDGATAVLKIWGGETSEPVVLYSVQGGGHTLPGGFQYLPPSMIGNTCRDFHGAEAIAEFFMEIGGYHDGDF